MDNNFNNENDEEKNINSGFEPPSSEDPLNLGFDEPYVQMPTTIANDNLAAVKPKKSRKGLIIALASLGTVIAACICCVLFIPSVNNMFKLYTQKPAAYYQDIEKKNIEENVEKNSEHIKELTSYMAEVTGELASMDNIYSFYTVQNLSQIPVENSTGYCNIELTVNDTFKSLIKSFTGNNGAMSSVANELINSLSSVSINSIATVNEKQQIAMDLSFTLNSSKVISANMIVDIKNYAMYFAIPEITDTVYSVKVPQEVIDKLNTELTDELKAEFDDLQEVYKMINDAVAYLDDNSDELIEFIERYTMVVVETLDEAEVNKNTEVDVNEVTVEYTEIVVKIDEAKFLEICQNVLDELKDDDFVKGLVKKLDVTEEQYTKYIEMLLEDLKDEKVDEDGQVIDFCTYVNTKGEIVGRALKFEMATISYVTYEKDEETQLQFSMNVGPEDDKFEFYIKGKCEGEDSKSGYLAVDCDVDKYDFNVKCEFEDAKIVNEELGYFNGKYTITTNFPELEPFAIVIDSKASKDSQSVAFDVLYNNDKTITLTFEVGTKEFEDIKIPENTFEITEGSSEQDIMTELKKINLVNVKNNLKAALKSETLNNVIDSAFTEAGLDAVDGSMTDDEINALVSIINDNTNNKIAYSDPEVIFDDDLDIAALK